MRVTAVLFLVLLAAPVPARAWGFDAHRFIADRAIDLLPAALKPLFEKRRAFIAERAIDPDLWRTAGWEQEPSNHFLDFDHPAFGPYPFEGLPRDYDAAVQAFGREFVAQQGLLPWRVQEFYGKLQRAFESLNHRPVPGQALNDIVYYSAILGHYVSDAHVPLHAVVNYDGKLTGQQGVHFRWEADLFDRNQARLKIDAAASSPVLNPRDFMFETLLSSNRLAAGVLEADRRAAAGRKFYDDAYFEAFRAGTWPVLERRLNDSISSVAAVIAGAWQRAGRPAVASEPPRTSRPIGRPIP